jgi:hypothetical protein
MNIKYAVVVLIASAALCCSDSYGQDLLNRMLSRGGCNSCEQAPTCCDTPAPSCCETPAPACGGGCGMKKRGGGSGLLSGRRGGDCGCDSCCGGNDCCEAPRRKRCGGCGLRKRPAGGDSCCAPEPACCEPAPVCGPTCPEDVGGGCGGGCGGGLFKGGLFGRNKGGCGFDACQPEPVPTCCEPAPVASCGCAEAPKCGCKLLNRDRASRPRRGGCGCGAASDCGCEPAPVDCGCEAPADDCCCSRVSLMDKIRARRAAKAAQDCCCDTCEDPCQESCGGGCGSGRKCGRRNRRAADCNPCCDSGCGNSGCGGSCCGGGVAGGVVTDGFYQNAPVMAEPTTSTEQAPAEAPATTVEPPVETPAADGDVVAPGDGANYQLRTPMVDPNAFLIGSGR